MDTMGTLAIPKQKRRTSILIAAALGAAYYREIGDVNETHHVKRVA